MQNLPIIGVPTQTLQAIEGIPRDLPHSWVMNHRYLTALASVGAAPILVPLLTRAEGALRAIFDALDGVFIAGGVDVDPSSYGAERREHCGVTDLDRDAVELLFARWAREEGKPIFGVCRGLQVMNVEAGGTLLQDTSYFEGSIKHDYYPTAGYARDHLAHAIAIEPDTRLREIYGAPEVQVNSMHHQGIDRLGEGLRVTARAPDGFIEAIEAPGDSFALGVQWHPEMMVESDLGTRRLFEAFVDAAGAFRRSAVPAL